MLEKKNLTIIVQKKKKKLQIRFILKSAGKNFEFTSKPRNIKFSYGPNLQIKIKIDPSLIKENFPKVCLQGTGCIDL